MLSIDLYIDIDNNFGTKLWGLYTASSKIVLIYILKVGFTTCLYTFPWYLRLCMWIYIFLHAGISGGISDISAVFSLYVSPVWLYV